MAVDYTQRSVTGSNADKTEELSLLHRGAGMLRQRRLLLSMALGFPVLMITWSLFTPCTFRRVPFSRSLRTSPRRRWSVLQRNSA